MLSCGKPPPRLFNDMPPISFLAVFLWLWIVAAVGINRLHRCDWTGRPIAVPIALGAIMP